MHMGPKLSPLFRNKTQFDLLDCEVEALSFILNPKKLRVGKKLNPLQDLKVAWVIFLERQIKLFEKGPFLEKKLHFNRLDDQVDTLSFILSSKLCMWERN